MKLLGVLQKLVKPIEGHFATYLFSNIFLLISFVDLNGFKPAVWMLLHFRPAIIQSMVLSIVVTYLCFILAKATDKICTPIGTAIRTFTFVAAFSISYINVFLHYAFGIILHHYAFVLLHETTANESSEFISTYLFSSAQLHTVLLMVVLPLAIYMLSRQIVQRTKKHRTIRSCSIIRSLGGGILLASLATLPFMLKWFNQAYITNYNRCPFVKSPIYLLYNGIGMYYESEPENQQCLEQCRSIVVDSCTFTSQNIVLIIGESYNRQHASLYGYHLPTTLPLDTISNLVRFTDVITPANATAKSFRSFFSTSESNPNQKWSDGPMFPAIFKKTGYDVNFWSTQFPYGETNDVNDTYAAYFNNQELSSLCFTHRNPNRFRYDGEMLDDYLAQRDKIESNSPTLSIFHLYGQHVIPTQRFPEGYGKFTIKDYADRELSDEQRQQVADYDNATLYNAEQVARIIDLYREKDVIVIYFADHGDEANDFRPHVGRSYDFPGNGADVVHCQFDIPFLIYTTDKYNTNHPEIFQSLASAKDRPYSIDALSHLMLYLAGIHTKWYNPTLNPLLPTYNYPQRLIYNLTTHEYYSYEELTR